MSEINRVKTAVVGVGHLGRHHLKWLNSLEQSELVGFYDIDRGKAEKYAREYQVTAFESLAELADKARAVSVVVPTTDHFEVASYLIERGVHCLIEKPLAASIDQALKLKQLVHDHGVTVTVGHIERFNPAVRALSEYHIKPSFIEAHRLAAFDPRGTDVAVVLDLMIHDIDLCLMFFKSNVIQIQASAVPVVSEQTDIANTRLTFENGAVANLTASRISLKEMRKLRIFQKSGYCSLDLAKKQADIYLLDDNHRVAEGMRIPLGKSGRDIVYQKKVDSGDDMLKLELESFLEAVTNGQPTAVPIEQGVEALRVALEVEQIGQKSLARMVDTESD